MRVIGNLALRALAVTACVAAVAAPPAAASAAPGAEATASASVKKKLKRLKRQLAELRDQVDGLAKGGGPAGGDLTGTYPDPLIAPDAVGSDEVAVNALTGTHVLESSLGQVPSADTSRDADTVDGHHAAREYAFAFRGVGDTNVLEWTQSIFTDGTGSVVGFAVSRLGGVSVEDDQAPHPYRCVFPLVR